MAANSDDRDEQLEKLARGSCAACGGELPAQQGRGRPRKFCAVCVPPGDTAAWRAANPDRVHEYNESRRVSVRTFYCVECRRPFASTRSDRLVCSRRCKDARYRRLHPEVVRAKERRKRQRRALR